MNLHAPLVHPAKIASTLALWAHEMGTANGLDLMSALQQVADPRRPSNGTRHDFQEILVIAVCAVLSDCDTVEDIAEWAAVKESWLRRFLVLQNGVPSQDTFLRLFRLIDPQQFEAAFRRWVGGIVTALGGQIAIDGKSLRGSADLTQGPVHMVSAFHTDLSLVLGQEKVAGKSNEITAIPELLAALDLGGYLVSIDAMGCQRTIAERIVTQGGDYLLAVKGNQPTLLRMIADAFVGRAGAQPRHEDVEKSHGRTVGQFAWVASAEGIVDPQQWPGCRSIGRILTQRVEGERYAEPEFRYYLSSRDLSADALASAARAHWGIENRLHWMLDVQFGEDACTVRRDHAPQNLSLLKKMVLNLIRTDTSDTAKASLRRKRKRAAWDDDIRMAMLGIKPL